MAASDGSEFYEVGSLGRNDSFARASNLETREEDEEELRWAALARLPSQKRDNFALLRRTISKGVAEDGSGSENVVDVRKLNRAHRELVVKQALATNDQDNYRLLSAIKERLDK